MPRYFYVKSGGALGVNDDTPYTSKQTGSFASLTTSNYYDNVEDVTDAGTKSNPPTSGDYILVSDAHVHNYTAGASYTGPTTGDFLYIVSVDDSNVDTEKASASKQEWMNSIQALVWTGRISFHSMWMEGDFSLLYGITDLPGGDLQFHRCYLESDFAGIANGNPGYNLLFVDCTFDDLYIGGGNDTRITVIGGTVTGSPAGWIFGKGADLTCYGVDLSPCSSIVNQIGNSPTADTYLNVKLHRCKLNASVNITNETLESYSHTVLVTNSSDNSAAAEYQYYFETYGGLVEDDTSIYRNNSTAYPSGQKISLKCTTIADANTASPFWFDFPTRYSTLSNTASDQIRIHILTSATLYNSDVWATVIYPDSVNQQTPNYVSTRHTDIMDANGTLLTTNVEPWTGRTSENRYHIDINTSGDAGADSVPIIRVFVAKASSVIYFCPTVELS